MYVELRHRKAGAGVKVTASVIEPLHDQFAGTAVNSAKKKGELA